MILYFFLRMEALFQNRIISFQRVFKDNILENVLESRFRKLPQGSDSDSGSEAESGRPTKLPSNVGNNYLIFLKWSIKTKIFFKSTIF